MLFPTVADLLTAMYDGRGGFYYTTTADRNLEVEERDNSPPQRAELLGICTHGMLSQANGQLSSTVF